MGCFSVKFTVTKMHLCLVWSCWNTYIRIVLTSFVLLVLNLTSVWVAMVNTNKTRRVTTCLLCKKWKKQTTAQRWSYFLCRYHTHYWIYQGNITCIYFRQTIFSLSYMEQLSLLTLQHTAGKPLFCRCKWMLQALECYLSQM